MQQTIFNKTIKILQHAEYSLLIEEKFQKRDMGFFKNIEPLANSTKQPSQYLLSSIF